ncbi:MULTISPECIES: dTDP-4-dehydrorhamnose reductase family protein [Flavobacteriaceae]|uniref:dTDP-4-dehydrorhamnose reductase n=1 Tax=Lutibacter litoralis TaxID=321268 RepID=A0ABV5K4Y0_9FLAO|nr:MULTISPECIES: SDR family oxidoreductase [Flavobacteriaceae]GGK60709.1 NAD(P)-dependent oxidoreductase [Lutibacter litoralis]
MEKVTKKVLILGSTGMLGHMLFRYLEKNTSFELFDIVFRNKLREKSMVCDVTDAKKLENLITQINPAIIVNCIGVLIKGSNSNPANAIYINSYLPHALSNIASKTGSKLIHISTDCVFSGKKGGYLETDFRDADDVYGRSKALGELNNEHDLTIRTSIIGPEIKQEGEGLLDWFLKQEGTINGFTKAFWGGVTTLELSKAILVAIQKKTTGLLQLTNGVPISKFEMLSIFQSVFERKNIVINATEGKEVDKSLKSCKTGFNFQVKTYQLMIEEMKNDMLANKNIYPSSYNL